ncbi:hypothetical protein [Methanobrevibacter filiformis]|uniref:Uncharacterized protein n=1 Tax=Methanobrevibacter filiformis TaxID=55758 RepID=A0A166A7C6_9EURY|nr:hypothetical protein [Methanobrevibacter filiformis]KZX11663.1 hypothetical protein MBFIL_13860 [Methanobrevibacter filiformis]
MIISLVKEQKGTEVIKEFENKYGSIDSLNEKWERTKNVLYYSDLEAWKYYLKNPDKKYKKTHSIMTNRGDIINRFRFEFIKHYKKGEPRVN